jgi:hypothetical protein
MGLTVKRWTSQPRFLATKEIPSIQTRIKLWLQSMQIDKLEPIPTTLSSSEFEKAVRAAIFKRDWNTAKTLIHHVDTKTTSSRRSLVYIICETCRRAGQISSIVSLLEALPSGVIGSEDDIMPLVNQCAEEKKMRFLQPIISYLYEYRRLELTAKGYSALLKGNTTSPSTCSHN